MTDADAARAADAGATLTPSPSATSQKVSGAVPHRRIAAFLAAGLGTGLSPFAPGTAGSLLGVVLGTAFCAASPLALLAATAAAAAIGLWSIRLTVPATGDDPSWVVIDEVAGQMLALLAVPHLGWLWIAAAFALFRLFDIAKPGPIGWADRQPGAFGIMADDLLAGAAAAVVLLLARAFGAT